MERLGLLAALLTAGHCCAQNLVPNGSFEEYYECPTSFGQWAQVVGWTSPYTESADYFNACAGGNVCSVPFNTAGFQEAAEGQAYMGIITYSTAGGGLYREMMVTELEQPLQPGVPVYCSFKASPGGFGSNLNNSAPLAARVPGIKFYTNLPETSQPWLYSDWAEQLFPNGSDIELPVVLNDTSTWLTVSGVFVPDSAYNWLVIANFYENSMSMAEVLDSSLVGFGEMAYAFIDDVCVSYDSATCAATNAIHPSRTVRSDLRASLAYGSLHLWNTHGLQGAAIQLFTTQGQLVWADIWMRTGSEGSMAVPPLSPALYILHVIPVNGIRLSLTVMNSTNP